MYLIDSIHAKISQRGTCFVSVVGGGGKTETIYQLAKKLSAIYPVLVTTTTAMFRPDLTRVDRLIIDPHLFESTKVHDLLSNPQICAGFATVDAIVPEKLRGFKPEQLCKWHRVHQGCVVLNEADGSKQLPVKAYEAHEPQIPSCTDIVLIVVGLDAMYQPIQEGFVHRPERMYDVTETQQGDLLTPVVLVKLMCHPLGMLKGIPESAEVILILNKYDCFKGDFEWGAFFESIPKRINALVVSTMARAEEILVLRRSM